MKNSKIKKMWESFYEKYKPTLEKWCGFPTKGKKDKYIDLPLEEWCEKEGADLMAKYSTGALKFKTLTKQQQSYKKTNKIKMNQIYTYFNMLRLMKYDYSISLEELCNKHIKPVLHLITDTIYKENFPHIKTIRIATWLKKNKKGINDIRLCLELPLTKMAHIAYDFYERKGYLYDSQQEMEMANLLFQWLHPDYEYIPHKRYSKSFYDFIEREDRSWTFLLDFTIIKKSTEKVICNIEVWQNSMEQAKKQKEGNYPGFKKRMMEYCTKQGGRDDKEAFWKTQPTPFIGVERRELFTKKGRKELLERLKKVVPLEKRELSKEFLDDFHEKVKKIRKVGNYSAFANPEDHYEKIYTEEERKEFEDELKLMMEKNGGELPLFLTFQNNKCCLGPYFSHIIYNTNLYTGGFDEVCKRLGDTRENTIKKRAENNRDINMLRCHGLTADSTEDDIKDVFCKVFIDFLNTMKNGDYYSQEYWGKYSDKLPKKTFGRAAEGRVNRTHFGNLKNPWGKKLNGKHGWFDKFRKDGIEWANKKNIKIPDVTFQKGNNDNQQHKEKEAKFIKLVAEKKRMLLSPQTILRHFKKKKLENPNLELTNEEKEEKVLMTWFKNCYEWLNGSRRKTPPQYVNETFKKFKDIPIIKDHIYVKRINKID